MSVELLQNFQEEFRALTFLERRRWPDGPACPHCSEPQRTRALRGQTTPLGTHKCYSCRRFFTVKTGTIFASSNVPVHKWLQAIYLCGVHDIRPSPLSEVLGVTFKTAAFMIHRIRLAVRSKESFARAPCSEAPLLRKVNAGLRFTEDESGARRRKFPETQFSAFLKAANQYSESDLDQQFEESLKKILECEIRQAGQKVATTHDYVPTDS